MILDIKCVKLPKDHLGFHYGLFVEEELVSVISLFIDNEHAYFRKFATLDKNQAKGYGTKLLKFLFTEINKYNLEKLMV